MPYIEQERREDLSDWDLPRNPGELNFCITRLVDDYIGERLSYSLVNDVVGALECAKMELYRRIAAPYEDTKIKANGDVYLGRS